MTANEKWNKIVALHKKYYNSPETKVQNVWESVFVEILGYSRLEGEVERHRNIQVGSTERIIPDVIVKNQDRDLFVVELKQHNISFQSTIEAQLFSYLKQLRNDIGILVCNKLYVYAFDYAKKDSEQLKWQISFTENNPEGIEFVEKFAKGGFNPKKIKALVLEKNRFNLNVERIVEKINQPTIVKVLKEYFEKSYTTAEVDEALSQVSISISKNGRIIASTPNIPPISAVGGRGARGETFSFEKCHIPKGAVLRYVKNPTITCTVYDDRKVEYQGQLMYMTPLVKLLTGSDVNVAGPMFFTYNDKNLQEYYKEYQVTGAQNSATTAVALPQNTSNMTKSEAVRLFNQAGVSVPKQCTFASLNKNGQYYWANPDVGVLLSDWWFILSDTKKRVLYCFMVPANTYHESQFCRRKDKNAIDFNVLYDEDTFIDRRSKIDLMGWQVKKLCY